MQIISDKKECVGGFIIFYTVINLEEGDFKLLKESFPNVEGFLVTKDGLEFRVFEKYFKKPEEIKKKEKICWETEYQEKKYGGKKYDR